MKSQDKQKSTDKKKPLKTLKRKTRGEKVEKRNQD